jgi:circadian clock protein KaiC
MDTWILLRNLESDGERNRGLYVLKSRGTAHSNQIREFRLSERGISLTPVYVGSAGVLTGTARSNQEANERAETLRRAEARQRLQRQLERKRRTLEAEVAALKLAFDAETEELSAELAEDDRHERTLMENVSARTRLRGGGNGAYTRSKANRAFMRRGTRS